jgi:hypothetical protein
VGSEAFFPSRWSCWRAQWDAGGFDEGAGRCDAGVRSFESDLVGAIRNSATLVDRDRNRSCGESAVYRSDSEMHDEPSQEIALGDTRLQSGQIAREWNVDQA